MALATLCSRATDSETAVRRLGLLLRKRVNALWTGGSSLLGRGPGGQCPRMSRAMGRSNGLLEKVVGAKGFEPMKPTPRMVLPCLVADELTASA